MNQEQSDSEQDIGPLNKKRLIISLLSTALVRLGR